MEYDNIFFDLDGTITDPKSGITKSVIYALDKMGITDYDRDNLTYFIGPPLLDSFMNAIGLTEEKSYEAIKIYREYYSVDGLLDVMIYEGIPELLRDLKLAGKRVVLATCKPTPFAQRILDKFGMAEYFDFVSGSLLNNTRTSKDEVIDFAIESLGGVIPERTVMVGDRKFDVFGGRRVGFITVGAGYGYAPEGEMEAVKPDYYAKDVEELRKILLS